MEIHSMLDDFGYLLFKAEEKLTKDEIEEIDKLDTDLFVILISSLLQSNFFEISLKTASDSNKSPLPRKLLLSIFNCFYDINHIYETKFLEKTIITVDEIVLNFNDF